MGFWWCLCSSRRTLFSSIMATLKWIFHICQIFLIIGILLAFGTTCPSLNFVLLNIVKIDYTGCPKVSVSTLIAYFSDICEYYEISFYPLFRLGFGFFLMYETPWYMQRRLRNMHGTFWADFQFLWIFCPNFKTSSQFLPLMTICNKRKYKMSFQ